MEALKDIFIDKLGMEMDQFEKFSSLLRTKTFKKKEYLIQEGSVCEFIGFVTSGK
ncbi:Crp/Fnr family transcriptional regulator, partial [Flavobacterium circumlabens]